MKIDEAFKFLAEHSDPDVREAIRTVQKAKDRRTMLIELAQEVMGQLRLDIKYIMFDLEATRQERDELRRKA